jgi:O-antigen ligase
MFLIGAWVGRKPGRTQRYVILIMLLAIPIAALDIVEGREQKVLWAGHVPSFLKVDDPVAALILSAAIRGATGLYRVKTTFSTPLGLAEYLALLTPFALHMMFGQYRLLTRVTGLLLLPLIFYCIRLTDARLGIVGFLVSIMLYVLFWGLLRLFRNRTDLFAAAVVYAYPTFFTAAAGAVLFVHRINVLVFGGGAQAASNEARKNQLHMGIPKILENPIGHGPGGSGAAMGYAAGDFITIDNYYLTLGLDYGVIGLAMFLAMFLTVITAGVRATVRSAQIRDREITLLIPLSVAMSAFLVIKLVFSQPDNHPLIYAMLGLLVGLIYRVQAANAEAIRATSIEAATSDAKKVKARSLVTARGPLSQLNRSPSWR